MSDSVFLITGGCGYLGSQLLRDLGRDAGSDTTIRILDNLDQGRPTALMDLPAGPNYEFIEGDILDPATVNLALDGVETVIHLAAVVRTPLSFDNPAWLKQVNQWGTANLVEACLRSSVRCLVYTSSTAVYGPGGPFSEGDTCQPQGHYAQSKLQAESAVLGAAPRGLDVSVLRLGVLYGSAPVTRFDAVVNRLAFLAGVGRSLTVYGDGKQRRPLLHVRDASSAVRYILANDNTERCYNVVGENVSISDLAGGICRLRPAASVRYTEQDIRTHYSFDVTNDRLLAEGWMPQVPLSEGLSELLAQFTSLRSPMLDQALVAEID